MLPTYPAVLRGGVLEWAQVAPPPLPADTSVPVHVTLLAPLPPSPHAGAAMAAALAAIADAGGPSGFGDPTAWQQESRGTRSFQGRLE